MQRENNIKLVKHVIRGLGAEKTDKELMRVSKAAPVVSELVAGFESSGTKRKKRKSKSLKEDLFFLSTKLRELRPFKGNRCRQMESFNKLSTNIIGEVEKEKLQEFVIRHSIRAMNKLDFNQDKDD
ncbi:hypothetical protein DPMN_186036 [Dreissena polymorpha]|uniref:Uncharacterized protein n=1 Tax=Dreissena polymorpha TaxID=45954 RepID=A0A9D4DNY9_DREPO|nr:hypothetical protein DPMN_186036 [Dreissena polymorpha]